MIFAIRGIMVMLGFFGVLYCLLSVLTGCVWRGTNLLRRDSASVKARLLFAIRIFPLAASAFITLAFALPAFLVLEPAAIDEDVRTLVFSLGALSLLAAGLFRVLFAKVGASRLLANWPKAAHVPNPAAAGPTLPAEPGLPPLLLYGVFTPRVLVSETAVALLSPDELRVALRHELCHMRSRDNLKKLIVHGIPFPGMGSLERAWQAAAEFAADEAAVSNPSQALDLAAALIKLSDLVALQKTPAFTSGLVNCAGLTKLRVERLLDWDEHRRQPVHLYWLCLLALASVTVAYLAAYYGQALLFTHRITEWFIH